MWGRPGDQIPRIYPAGSVSPGSFAPSPLALELPLSWDPPYPGISKDPEIQPPMGRGWGGAVCEDLGLRAGLKGQWGTLCP